ncbi:hypothetical protein K7I13_13510 [Brucepastera parasyntrophica]|uniref:hypothetical protein n=1 Tax=Brucepastera parasyntrophica TaxID=2880008 RepID=UPI00210A9210|nr:hypothetical protein [Brucepastera parasyntrophica]ULQ59475.1 hypothetical protein K7I13_13510 [Brucepastera parasyntrophica]
MDKNFGFGIFNRTVVVGNVPSLNWVTAYAGEELLLVGGYGLKVFETDFHSLSVGLQLKGFFQLFLIESGTSLNILNKFIDFDFGSMFDSIPAVFSTGFGLDLGIQYRLSNWFDAAIVCRDVYTPVFSTRYASGQEFLDGNRNSDTIYDTLSPDLTVGVVFTLPLPTYWTTITKWTFMLDYRDILFFLEPLYKNPILNLAAGTELILLDVISLRCGISDMYFAAGVGLNFSIFKLDLAMYGKELGIDPGTRPLLNILLSLSFEY